MTTKRGKQWIVRSAEVGESMKDERRNNVNEGKENCEKGMEEVLNEEKEESRW